MSNRGLIACFAALLLLWFGYGNATAEMPIEEFARQTFIHGVPYEEARQYRTKEDAVSKLLGMLADFKQERYWSNVVVTLCMIGDDRAVDPLIAFVEKGGDGTLSPAHYNAKTSALIAVGYLINKTGNKKALEYLKSHITPTAWKEDKLHWMSPYQPLAEQRDVELSTMAILGLALSGHPDGRVALTELKKKPRTGAQAMFQEQVRSVVDEAIQTNEEIAKGGMSAYYAKGKP